MSGWTRTRLGDLIAITRGTTYKSQLLGEPGPVLLGLASIQRNGGFRSDKLRTYGGDSPEKLLVRPGELYASLKDVTQSGDLLGSVARLPAAGPVGRLSQDTVRLDVISDAVDPDFLYLSLLSPRYRAWCRQHATGTTNLGLPRDDFLAFEVSHPVDRDGQRKVSAILNLIDDLIENNRRRIEVLEEMARAIYREWFVKFRYPGHADASLEIPVPGAFPSGWRESRTDELIGQGVIEIGDGYRAKNSEMADGGIPFLRVGNVRRGFIELGGADSLPESYVHRLGPKLSRPGDTVLATKGTVGRMARITARHNAMAYSPQVSYWRSLDEDEIAAAYLHEWLHSDEFAVQCSAAKSSTAMADYLSLSDQRRMKMMVPPRRVVRQFSDVVGPIHRLADELQAQTNALTETRDLLLPKLVIGQIDVSTIDLDVVSEDAGV